MGKAVSYLRYSSDNQNETSIEHQRRSIMAYCVAKKVELVEEYIDQAFSGTNDKRPGFQRLIRDAKNSPEWDAVLVFDLSRFCRNSHDAAKYTAVLEDNDIQLVSVTQVFDDTIEGNLMKQIVHSMNEFYSKCNARATHAGMSVKATKAGHCGGIPPLGYDLDVNGNLVINEGEAEVVRKIYDMVEKSYSYQRIADILNADGYRTKMGNLFTKNSFDRILHQEKYIGIYTWNKTRQKNREGRRSSHAEKPIEKQIRTEQGCPRIIADEQFQRVQDIMVSRAMGKGSSKSRHHYMLGGLKIMKCACCGSYMVGETKSSHGRKYTVYTCPKHKGGGCPTKDIRTEGIDTMVAGLLVRDLYDREDGEELSRQMQHENAYKTLQAKKRSVESAITRVGRALEKRYSDELITRLGRLEADKAALEKSIAAVKKNSAGFTEENRKEICNKFGTYICKVDDPDAKSYIMSVVKEILVSNDTVSVQLRIA